ncbi:Arc family DNA-binding protein [Rhizobium rhizogenes]|uniref:Arc-like DNA binding domain-containing protein n=1 Tax=Rhizobium rhizogenes NBRC 13257 TaxID=1220581 RepID=A0AA87QB16_RHIRH|nr:Arc family DNA-binding protein [Rhizobium rhizogenes]NTG65397.1 Arc family DNA-binding protein [Rhizobium rhizogenes]NTI66260.1 Arc family DNA-binding protein [Rhizobium rhizogenes]NTI79169.1 Arc family DNA-binding protein [Rhizobium rhizogenes]NTJ21270.1 Arc family DNA-binding protein [Rhizobium rhizogenes]QUE80033.1 Arc family DNA-binding protein [Rhizobium rhizogenes]
MSNKYPSEKLDQLPVRLPDGMRARIKESAKKNCRSMNAEIIFQLTRAYTRDETQKADAA